METGARVPRRERERARHRQEILDAARKVLEARGIAGVTVEEVAREADFAVGSIYRHFRSKEELLDVLALDLAVPMVEELEALPSSGAPFEAQLEAYARIVQRHLSEAQPVVQAFLGAPGAMPAPGTEARGHARDAWSRYFAAIAGMLAGAQAAGVLAPGDTTGMVIALHGMVTAWTRWVACGRTAPGDDVGAWVRRAFLEGFRARP